MQKRNRQQKQQKRKPARAIKARKAAPRAQSSAALEKCEEMYLRALANPFDPAIRGQVCYPSFPAKQSVKFTGNQTVNVTIGTGGVGWVMYDLSPSNTSNCIYYTDGTYTGTAASSLTKTTGSGVSAASWSTPTSAASFAEGTIGNQFRMVAAGASFRYTGTELNRGGSVFSVVSPQQVTLDAFTIGNAATPTISRELPVRDVYQCTVLPPAHEEDVEWKDGDQIFPWSDGGSITANPIAALIFFGTVGNTFVVRLIEHYEVSGNSWNMFGSMSHVGRQQVVQSITAAASSATFGAPEQGRSYLQQFGGALRSISSNPVVKTAASMVGQFGLELAARRLGLGRSRPPPGNLLMPGRYNAIDVD